MSTIERPSDLARGGEGILPTETECSQLYSSNPLASLLIQYGFAKLIPSFEREEICMNTFLDLTEEDLREMGIGIGPSRALLRLIKGKEDLLETLGVIPK